MQGIPSVIPEVTSSGCELAVALDSNGAPSIIRANGECSGNQFDIGYLKGTLTGFESIEINKWSVFIKKAWISSPQIQFDSDVMSVSGPINANVTYRTDPGIDGCATTEFLRDIPVIKGKTKTWDKKYHKFYVNKSYAEIQSNTVKWKRTGCNSFTRDFGTF